MQLNRTSQASLNTRSSSQQSFPTRDDRNVRFSNIRDHLIQRALTETHRGSYVACQGAATPPSPTVIMPQSSADEGGQEGVETGDSGEGGEVETIEKLR